MSNITNENLIYSLRKYKLINNTTKKAYINNILRQAKLNGTKNKKTLLARLYKIVLGNKTNAETQRARSVRLTPLTRKPQVRSPYNRSLLLGPTIPGYRLPTISPRTVKARQNTPNFLKPGYEPPTGARRTLAPLTMRPKTANRRRYRKPKGLTPLII